MTVLHSDTINHTYEQLVKVDCTFSVGLLCVFFPHFVPVLFAFVVLGLVSSVLSQEIGCEEGL